MQDIRDELAIRRLIADYAYGFDEQDPEGMGGLFLTDCLFEEFYPGQDKPIVSYVSRAEFVAEMRHHLDTFHGGLVTRTHFSSIRLDELHENWAPVRGIVLVTGTQESNDHAPLVTGLCEWEFERTTLEDWRIRRFSQYLDQPYSAKHPWPLQTSPPGCAC